MAMRYRRVNAKARTHPREQNCFGGIIGTSNIRRKGEQRTFKEHASL